MKNQIEHEHEQEHESPKAEDLSVNTLIVMCGCSDGALRVVKFDDEGKQARKVHGFIRHIQGGGLQLKREPVLILMDTPEHREAIEQIGIGVVARVRTRISNFFNRKSKIQNRKSTP